MSDTAPTATPVYRREIPHWDEPFPERLKRDSLKQALTSYILEANHEGYHPNPRKVLAVKLEDKNTTLRNAGTPVRNEVYFVVEGEVFPGEGTTRLTEGQSPADLAELLVEQVYEKLWIWAAYDFSKGSGGGFRKPFDQPLIQRGSANPNPERKTRRAKVPAEIDTRFFLPDPVEPYRPAQGFVADLPSSEIVDLVKSLVAHDFRNILPEGDNPPIYTTPVVGIASAQDPIFARFQDPEVVGPQFRLPEEWLPGAQSIISVFLPFSDAILKTYRKESRFVPVEYTSGKRNGSKFLNVVRRRLVRFAEDWGAKAVAPNIDVRYDSDRFRPFWSERHVAFAAGIGTFGLQAAIITEHGSVGRIGSVVTTLKLDPTVRPYREVFGHCLYAFDGSCRLCIDRCPSKALSPAGKEVELCPKNGADPFHAWGYGGSCGHCSTFVPCSRAIPAKIKKATQASEIAQAV